MTDLLAWLLGGFVLIGLLLLAIAVCKLCLCMDRRLRQKTKEDTIEDSIVMVPSPCFVECDSEIEGVHVEHANEHIEANSGLREHTNAHRSP